MGEVLGLLVNPIAGMGGRVGLHGTDGPARLAEARRRGATPVTEPRTRRALKVIAGRGVPVLAAPGKMGAEAAAASGIDARSLDFAVGREPTAEDTRHAALMLADAGVGLLLFAGGDGTAVDILGAVGPRVPVLGIPSGVKMRSGVFASSPESAGELAAEFLSLADRPLATAEVVDAVDPGDESQKGAHPLAVEFFGEARVPGLGLARMPGAKSSTLLASPGLLDALCRAVAEELVPSTLYLFGPGSTTGRILGLLDLPNSPLGVDAVRDGALVGADLGEQAIVELIDSSVSSKLVLGVIGGQGFLLGRGNQQIGASVLSRLSPEDLVIVSAADKLVALQPPLLRVDVGDEVALAWATGYHRVRVGPNRYMMMRVAAAA